MEEKRNAFEIKPDQRQSWFSITMVWAGAMICVTCLMVGGLLGSFLTLGQAAVAVVIGYALVVAYMSLIGMQGCDLGLPTAILAGASLGQKGGKYVISSLLAIACVGWFGVQSAVCGMSFSAMFATIFNVQIPVWLSILFWGVIMLITASFGFKGLKLLNTVAVPLLIIVCLYGLILAIARNDGLSLIAVYQPAVNMGLVFGINYTIATFALGGVIAGDYCRFAKSRKDVIKSSFLGVIPAGFAIMMIGAILTIVTGGTFANYFPGLVAAAPWLNISFFVGPINGIVVSLVLYAIIGRRKAVEEAAIAA